MVCVISWKVHVKLFLPKGRIRQNTRSEVTGMTNTCMHTNKYNGGFQKRRGREEFAGFQISAFWLEYSSILTGLCYYDLLMPTIFLHDEQICCYICVYNFSPSLVVAPGLWINYKPQTLWFQFPTMPPHILFAPPLFMPPLPDNSLYFGFWWSVASSGKHDHRQHHIHYSWRNTC